MPLLTTLLGAASAVSSILKSIKPGTKLSEVVDQVVAKNPNLAGNKAIKIAQWLLKQAKRFGYGGGWGGAFVGGADTRKYMKVEAQLRGRGMNELLELFPPEWQEPFKSSATKAVISEAMRYHNRGGPPKTVYKVPRVTKRMREQGSDEVFLQARDAAFSPPMFGSGVAVGRRNI